MDIDPSLQEEYDYTGVPLKHLRQVIEQYRGRKVYKQIAIRAGIDSREFARILRIAPDKAILGLNKADRIISALGHNLSDLAHRGEIAVVPVGASKVNALNMARDELYASGVCPTPERVQQRAKELKELKEAVLVDCI